MPCGPSGTRLLHASRPRRPHPPRASPAHGAEIRAASTSRSIATPNSAARAGADRSDHSWSEPACGSSPMRSSSSARTIRLRSLGCTAAAGLAPETRVQASARARPAPLDPLAQCRAPEAASVQLRERGAQVEPRPPTTIGVASLLEQGVDLAWAPAANSPDAVLALDRDERDQPVLEPLELLGAGFAASVSSPSYTWIASADTATGRWPRARSSSASSIATSVLPTPVGPNIAIEARRRARAGCSSPAERRRGRARDLDGDQLPRPRQAGEVDGLVVPGAAAQPAGSVRLGPSTSTSCVVPTKRLLRSSARR